MTFGNAMERLMKNPETANPPEPEQPKEDEAQNKTGPFSNRRRRPTPSIAFLNKAQLFSSNLRSDWKTQSPL